MNRFFVFLFIVVLSNQLFSQKNLNNYHFVVVPPYFDFLGQENQYQLNEMARFYLEKKGFVVVSVHEVYENTRCNGLYADVEYIKSLFGTRLQFVLSDCNKNEIFRSKEGRSKLKEFEKSYQDALRKAMNDLPQVRMKPYKQGNSITKEDTTKNNGKFANLPSLQTYQKDGKYFLIRKTSNGHTLYEETRSGDLNLIGNFIDDAGIKFIDNEGNVIDVEMDNNSNLILINKDGKQEKYLRN